MGGAALFTVLIARAARRLRLFDRCSTVGEDIEVHATAFSGGVCDHLTARGGFHRTADGRIGRFGRKAQVPRLNEFNAEAFVKEA
jgi:hypothetical protein